MNNELRKKYNLSDKNPTFRNYGYNDNIDDKNTSKCSNCIFIMFSTYTMLNTFYYGSLLYVYLKYFQDIDDTYEQLKLFLNSNNTFI